LGHGGVGLVEALVGLVIGMLIVLAVFQVYAISESHKRTIVAGSDAQQSAAYALHLIARDAANAGSGIASAAMDELGRPALDGCALLRPLPALIEAGARAADPDAVTLFYAASGSLASPATLLANAAVPSLATAETYGVAAPAGFSPHDVIAAVDGTNCTLSTIDADGVRVAETGVATLKHTPVGGSLGVTYIAGSATVVNLGRATSLARVRYSVDPSTRALRAQQLLPAAGPVHPVLGDIVNLKVQYGLDTDGDGTVDAWQSATGDLWSAANLPLQPLATLRRIQSLRIAVVARASQWEKAIVTPGPLALFDGTLSVPLTADQQHYRYHVVETVVPLRNAIWNAP
jgi:type IV pilus assembly protein PilW